MNEKEKISSEQSGGTFIKLIKFFVFSLGTGIIDFGTFGLLTLINDGKGFLIFASIMSTSLACLYSMTVNRRFTFKSSTNIYFAMIAYAILYLMLTPLGAVIVVNLTKAGVHKLLAKWFQMAFNFIVEFSFCNFFLFRKKKEQKTKPDVFASDDSIE